MPRTEWRAVTDKPSRERWNDWGIGLLLQGDLKGAEFAFRQVTQAEPEYADGWLNVARALIQEGETEAAKPFIAQALARNESLGRIHFFKAMVEKADGDYLAALASLERAAALYPRDRVVLNQMARILFLDRRYAEALAVLDRVAAVDPEDVQMHYTAMLAARGLGDEARAEREEQPVPPIQGRRVVTGDHRATAAGERRGQQRAPVDSRARERAAESPIASRGREPIDDASHDAAGSGRRWLFVSLGRSRGRARRGDLR